MDYKQAQYVIDTVGKFKFTTREGKHQKTKSDISILKHLNSLEKRDRKVYKKDSVFCNDQGGLERAVKNLYFEGILPVTSKTAIERSESDVVKSIRDRFNSNFQFCNNFWASLKCLDGVVAGSYILQCYYQEYWKTNGCKLTAYLDGESGESGENLRFKPSDIDMYFNVDKFIKDIRTRQFLGDDEIITKNELIKFIKKMFFNGSPSSLVIKNLVVKSYNDQKEKGEVKSIFDIATDKDLFPSFYGDPYTLKYIIKFSFGNQDFDIMLVSRSPRYFIESFDFDFCKIYYDGCNVHMCNKESILTRTCYHNAYQERPSVNDYSRFVLNLSRYIKYSQRGFNILLNSQNNIFIKNYTECKGDIPIPTSNQKRVDPEIKAVEVLNKNKTNLLLLEDLKHHNKIIYVNFILGEVKKKCPYLFKHITYKLYKIQYQHSKVIKNTNSIKNQIQHKIGLLEGKWIIPNSEVVLKNKSYSYDCEIYEIQYKDFPIEEIDSDNDDTPEPLEVL